jgi:Na+/H+ antiporter NhaA
MPPGAAFDRIVSPLEAFVHRESASGLVLMAVTLLALVLANSPWGTSFHRSPRVGPLPTKARFGQRAGVGLLNGIGSTMSIFIGELAFAPHPRAAPPY